MHSRHFLIAALPLALAACASAPIEVAPDAQVFNRTHKQIKTIAYRPCDTPNADWTPVQDTAIAGGTMLRLTLPAACTDLQAWAVDGKVIGTQTGVKRQFPFRWQLY
ncbi:MAG: hypothetical protein U1F63_02385 [Chitinivorax sp.]